MYACIKKHKRIEVHKKIMAIGALFTPKLAGKVHNLHYQSIQQKQTK